MSNPSSFTRYDPQGSSDQVVTSKPYTKSMKPGACDWRDHVFTWDINRFAVDCLKCSNSWRIYDYRNLSIDFSNL